MNSHKLKRVLQKGDIHLAYISRLYIVALLILFNIRIPYAILSILMIIFGEASIILIFLHSLMILIKLGYKQNIIKYILLLLFSFVLLLVMHIESVGYYNKNIFTNKIYEILIYIGLVLLILYITKLLLDKILRFKNFSIAIVLLVVYLYSVIINDNSSNVWFTLVILLFYCILIRRRLELFLVFIAFNLIFYFSNFMTDIAELNYILISLVFIIYILFGRKKYIKKLYISKFFVLYILLLILLNFILSILYQNICNISGVLCHDF